MDYEGHLNNALNLRNIAWGIISLKEKLREVKIMFIYLENYPMEKALNKFGATSKEIT